MLPPNYGFYKEVFTKELYVNGLEVIKTINPIYIIVGPMNTFSNYYGLTQTAIQDAIDYLAANGGGTVFLRKATYVLTSSIILRQDVSILADIGTILQGDGATNLIYSETIFNSIIENLTFNSCDNPIFLTCGNTTIRNCIFNASINAIRFNDKPYSDNVIDSCIFNESVESSIYLNPIITTTTVKNCRFINSSIFGMGINSESSTNIKDCYFKQQSISIQFAINCIINNCIFEDSEQLLQGYGIPTPNGFNYLLFTSSTVINSGSVLRYLNYSMTDGNYEINIDGLKYLKKKASDLAFNWEGNGSTNLIYKVSGMNELFDIKYNNINTHQDSYLKQPDIFTPDIQRKQYGMIYLDNGTNTDTGRPRYRTYLTDWFDM